MWLATYQGERSLSRVIQRLFEIKGPGSRALAREAEMALLQANPHLRDLTKVPAGALIVVPEVSGIKPAEEVRPVENAVGDVLHEFRQGVDSLLPKLKASVTRQTEEANNTLKALQSRELRELARQEPAMQKRLDTIAAEAQGRLTQAEALKNLQDRVLPQLDKDLGDFVRFFGIRRR